MNFKDTKSKSALSTRWAQMSKQEQIIERKKMEIQAKMEAQKQAAALAAQAKLANAGKKNLKEDSANIFSNDGSFMSQFKALLEKQKQKQRIEENKIKREEEQERQQEKWQNEMRQNENYQFNQDEGNEHPSNEQETRESHHRWNDGTIPNPPSFEDTNKPDNKNIPPLMQIPILPPEEPSESTNQWSSQASDSNDDSNSNDQPPDSFPQFPSGPPVGPRLMAPGPGPHWGPGSMGPGPKWGPPHMMGPGGPNMPAMPPGPIPPWACPPFPMPPNYMGPRGPMPPNMCGPNTTGQGPNRPMPQFFGQPFPHQMMGPNGPPNQMMGPNGPPNQMMMGPNGPPNQMMGPNGPPNQMMGPNGPPNQMMGPNGPPNQMMGPNGPPNPMMVNSGPPNQMMVNIRPTNQTMGPNGPPNQMMDNNSPSNQAMGPNGPPNQMMCNNGPPNQMMGPNGPPNQIMGPNGPSNQMMGQNASLNSMMGQNRPPNPRMGSNGPPNPMMVNNGPANQMMGSQNNYNMPFMPPLGPNGPNFGNNGPNFGNNGPPMPFLPPNSMALLAIPEPKPLDMASCPHPESMKLQSIPPPGPMTLSHIPKPNEMDPGTIPPPSTSQVLSADLPPPVARAAAEVATNGDHWENVLKTIYAQDQNMWFLHNPKSKEYQAFREVVLKLRASKTQEVRPEDKYEPEFCMDDDSNDEDSKTGIKEESKDSLYESNQSSWSKEIDSKGVKQEASSQSDDESEVKRERRKRKRSRWGDDPPVTDIKPPGVVAPVQSCLMGTALPPGVVAPLPPALSAQQLPPPIPGVKLAKIDGDGLKLTNVNRNNVALMQYAINNYGSANLSPEDWKKCEDNFKLNLLFQDMMKKRQEVERLAAAGKHKYEYDSDEDTADGTWEHRLRTKEMSATEKWANELTKQAEGKHHIGDFLPPEELKKFMEKYSAAKMGGKEPDLSDYKEFKLKEDNVGFKMLQKLGWNEGQGLGADGTGIVEPVNKSNQPVANMGLGAAVADAVSPDDDEFDAYRKRMMLAYRFRPNPLNNPRRPYY